MGGQCPQRGFAQGAGWVAMNTLDWAREYYRRAWRVVPIPTDMKAPALSGWPDLTISVGDLARYFGTRANIGIRLGSASGDLVDVDLDCPEALAIAHLYLPGTQAMFGRQSKPRSHWLYVAAGAVKESFADPLTGSTLLELRADGRQGKAHQTVFPPSVADGEQREWEGDVIAPRLIDAALLRKACAWLAIGSIMMRHLSEHAARNPARDMPALLWEADRPLGRAAYRWLGIPNPDMPRLRPRPRRYLSADEINLAEIANAIPNHEDWHGWVAVGLAIFAADSSDHGAIIFDDWSAKSPRYNPYTTAAKWREFHRYPPDRTGINKLIKMAIDAGWQAPVGRKSA
jgi:Bifunctional DNA primase/polymerase, N-terminal/Primase C terminal 2 (PriCT-2)